MKKIKKLKTNNIINFTTIRYEKTAKNNVIYSARN